MTIAAVIALFLPGGNLLRASEVSVAEADAKKAATYKVAPEYPAIARQLNLSGRVEVQAKVDESGKVASVSIKTGNPVLGTAARAAVMKWTFTPFSDNGQPAAAMVSLSFDFKQ